MNQANTRNLIRAQAAAAILGISRWQVWKWARDGKLEIAEKAGTEALFDEAYVRAKAAELNSEQPKEAAA